MEIFCDCGVICWQTVQVIGGLFSVRDIIKNTRVREQDETTARMTVSYSSRLNGWMFQRTGEQVVQTVGCF